MRCQLPAHVQHIFELLGHPEIDNLQEADSFAQENFIRKGERWDQQVMTPCRKAMPENREALIGDLKGLGMIDEVPFTEKHVTYVGLLGALKERVELRMDYLEKLIQEGLTFEYLVLLGGMRELQEFEKAGLPAEIVTESDMMHYVAQHSSLKDCQIIQVNAPMIQKADGTTVRPTTDDTIKHFLANAPKKGSFLVISNNPYIARNA